MSTPTPEIRVGLIGCGRIAGVHRRYLQTTPGVRIVGVCDMDLERARAFGAEAGAEEVCRDAADLLRLPLDAVHVLTPPSSHAEWQAVGGPMGELRAVLRGSQALGFLCFSPGATPYLNALTLRGTKATLHIDLNTMTLLRQRPRRLPSMLTKAALNIDQAAQLVASTVRTSWRVATRRMGTYPGIGAVIRGFHAAVQNQGEPPVSAADGRVVVDLLEQLWTRTHDARATVTRPRPTAPRPSSNGSTVLVTGASGFLGQHVLAALRERGHHVRAMVRFPRLSEEWQDVEEVVAALGD